MPVSNIHGATQELERESVGACICHQVKDLRWCSHLGQTILKRPCLGLRLRMSSTLAPGSAETVPLMASLAHKHNETPPRDA